MSNNNPMHYGIWGLDPRGTSWIDEAVKTGKGVTDILGQHYTNRKTQEEAEKSRLGNEQTRATQPGLIEMMNTENAAKTKYFPQQQEAGLNLTKSQTTETLARAMAAKAQAKDSLARMGLYGPQAQQYLAEADKARAQAEQARVMSGLGAGNMNFETPGGPTLNEMTSPGATAGLVGGGLTLNPWSTFRNKGTQQGQVNPDGTTTTIESPTAASTTYAQTRAAAEPEMNKLFPVVKKGFGHYTGPGGSIKLAKDVALYQASPDSKGGKAAGKRLTEYNLAMRYMPELAAINARQSTGQSPGIEVLREYEQALQGGAGAVPNKFSNYLIPQSIRNTALDQYLPIQQGATNAAIEAERTGFPITSETKPSYLGGNPAQQESQEVVGANGQRYRKTAGGYERIK